MVVFGVKKRPEWREGIHPHKRRWILGKIEKKMGDIGER